MERRIKSLVRWNALAMVVRANRIEHNIGGHISTYGSAATLYDCQGRVPALASAGTQKSAS